MKFKKGYVESEKFILKWYFRFDVIKFSKVLFFNKNIKKLIKQTIRIRYFDFFIKDTKNSSRNLSILQMIKIKLN